METLNASDAKREFGDMLLKAQEGAGGINKNCKPVAVIISASDYKDIETMKRTMLQQEIQQGLADIEAGRVVDGPEVIQALRKQVLDANL
ncbi:MAG: antitoxin [Gammaproteobacteria bacterium]|nr:MAG: antitoxin [Gammaproteobacteria bacterium]